MEVCKTSNGGSSPPLAFYTKNKLITIKMKKNKVPLYPKINLICTDGSTIQSNFLYSKDDSYINPDIRSNLTWLPENMDIELDGLSGRSSKYKKYEFNFESLVNSKS